jgi:hypothetical protein
MIKRSGSFGHNDINFEHVDNDVEGQALLVATLTLGL